MRNTGQESKCIGVGVVVRAEQLQVGREEESERESESEKERLERGDSLACPSPLLLCHSRNIVVLVDAYYCTALCRLIYASNKSVRLLLLQRKCLSQD